MFLRQPEGDFIFDYSDVAVANRVLQMSVDAAGWLTFELRQRRFATSGSNGSAAPLSAVNGSSCCGVTLGVTRSV